MPPGLGRCTRVESRLLEDSDDDDIPLPPANDLIPEHHVHRGAGGDIQHHTTLYELPPSPTKPAPVRLVPPPTLTADDPSDMDTKWDAPSSQQEEEVVYDLLAKAPRKLRPSDDPMCQWVDRKKPHLYLDELILLEGRGDYQDRDFCIICFEAPGVYRCRDCFTDDLYCQTCMVRAHGDCPLHRIEVRIGILGLRIQLGHGKRFGVETQCVNPIPAFDDDFVVVDTYAIYEVHLDFCGCETAQAHDIQLLRARWYPSTSTNPRSTATFTVLRRFHLLTLESKDSVSEFYNSIARETDNTGTRVVRDRYDEFARMTRQWRHLRMLKRAGRGHDAAGVKSTKPGECALLCPACPQPGKNLPADWQAAPKHKRFVYALFLALDANFRMRRKKVSSESDDPSLDDGWSFFVPVVPYYKYLADNWKKKQEHSTCVAHDAVDKPDRESRGTACSGIATVDCARHNMKRPNAVGDLPLGERYINMDYIFFIGLAGSEVSELYVSYDIVCQWHKNLFKRMKNTFPEETRFHRGKQCCVFLIPKFHLSAHIEACNVLFSFHLTRYVGMTDGEALERGWSLLNPFAGATAEMGPGNRWDSINDVFNDMNYKKVLGLGKWILDRLTTSIPELIAASTELEELEASLRSLGGEEDLEKWRAEVEAWEEDSTKLNPFESRVAHKTVVEVRHELAKEVKEGMDADELEGLATSEEIHPTELIGMGLQLEELQRGLNFDMQGTGNHPTEDQQANLTERTNKPRRKLLTWMDTQVLFMPHVVLLRAEEDRVRMKISSSQAQPGVRVQHMALWLPSSIKGRAECDEELYHYEFRLREAQASEALDLLRKNLLVHTHLYKYKDRFARGVKSNTRLTAKINAVEDRLRRIADRYRAARRALEGLGGVLDRHEWRTTLLPLAADDVRGMPRALFQDPERKKADAMRREARVKMSWIWRSAGLEDGGAEALRIEWAKTRARFLRRVEEIDLLEEESHRILQFLRWRADWWEGNTNRRPQNPADGFHASHVAFAPKHLAYAEGNIAYAKRQAAMLRKSNGWIRRILDFIAMGRAAMGSVPEDEFVEGGDGEEGDERDAEEDGGADELPLPPRSSVAS
ncbi:CxC2 domain-containing protein [Favolaschia claudopus]|uniref:CxC2 domain-containing protein n=1 Tax=Favolaschia claudopus TaxID=2862362 RepID=A0AAV9ZLS8_9AGAR